MRGTLLLFILVISTIQAIKLNDPGLTLYLNFDNRTTPYLDLKGNARPTCTSCPTWEASDKTGGVLHLNGSQWLTLPHGDYQDSLSITISFWVNLRVLQPANTKILCKSRTPYVEPFVDYCLGVNGPTAANDFRPIMMIGNTNNYFLLSATKEVNDQQVGRWHHISGVFHSQNRTMFIYVDGTRNAVNFTDPLVQLTYSKQNPIYIGCRQNGLGCFDGQIDDVAIWTRALSENELKKIYDESQLAVTPWPINDIVVPGTETPAENSEEDSPVGIIVGTLIAVIIIVTVTVVIVIFILKRKKKNSQNEIPAEIQMNKQSSFNARLETPYSQSLKPDPNLSVISQDADRYETFNNVGSGSLIQSRPQESLSSVSLIQNRSQGSLSGSSLIQSRPQEPQRSPSIEQPRQDLNSSRIQSPGTSSGYEPYTQVARIPRDPENVPRTAHGATFSHGSRFQELPARSGHSASFAHSVPAVTKFGQPLSSYKMAGNIPEVVELCVKYLEENSMNNQGILRLTGDISEAKYLRDIFEAGKVPEFSNVKDANSVVDVLKSFLRSLPQKILLSTQSIQEAEGVLENYPNRFIEIIQSELEKIPQLNYNIIKRIFGLMYLVSQNHASNRMKADSIANVFQPLLSLPLEVIRGMIVYYQHIFQR